MGLGKLGLPVALATESKGHKVLGYDISPKVHEIIETRRLPYLEQGAQQLLDKTKLKIVAVPDLVAQSDLIFVPIQTPHDPRFEGITTLPSERKDFDYSYLKAGVKTLADEIKKQGKDKIVIIISTVLPGTVEREIKPLLNKHVKLCYNPFFIAMGTTIKDYTNPEFVLLGVDDPKAAEIVKQFYSTIHNRPVKAMSIRNAEATKVFYNTFISSKVVFGNMVMEVAHKKGLDCDVIIDALALATDRIVSPKYMRGGMLDSGSCHPRDNIALSWLARETNLSVDLFENIMLAREKQTAWLADIIIQYEKEYHLPIVILGKAYKPETNLVNGSGAILLNNLLLVRGFKARMYDPYIDHNAYHPIDEKAIYFIATKHSEFADYTFSKGSIVLDPFRYIPKQKGVTIIHIGKQDQPQKQKVFAN